MRPSARAALAGVGLWFLGCPGSDPPSDGATWDVHRPDGDAEGGPDGDVDRPPVCTYGDDDVFDLAGDAATGGRRVSVAAGAEGFLVAWSDQETSTLPRAVVRRIPLTGPAGARVELGVAGARHENPSVAVRDGGYLAAWVSNAGGDHDVVVATLDGDGLATGEPRDLSGNDLLDENPWLTRIDDAIFALWVASDSEAATRTAYVRVLDGGTGADAGDRETLAASPSAPSTVRLAKVGEKLVSVWPEARGSSTDVLLQRVGADGAPSGPLSTVSREGNIVGLVDVAGSERGGALVFGVAVGGSRREVRLRTLDDQGAPSLDERIVTPAPVEATDPSLAPFAGGYVVTYRAIAGGAEGEPELTLAFVSDSGRVLGATALATTTVEGGATLVRAAPDGTLLVAWGERAAGSARVRALRLRCGT